MLPRPRLPRAAGVLLAAMLIGAASLGAAPTDTRPLPGSSDLGLVAERRAAADPGARPSVEGLSALPGAYRFVSHPDFLNQDVGDVTGSPHWRKGDPRGTNDSYETSLAHVLDDIAAQDPSAVLVAGDLVEGAWGMDVTGAGTFGPTRTVAERRSAVRAAAAVYLKDWRRRFEERGLPVYPAVGDHEIGDDPWTPQGRSRQREWLEFKGRHTWLWKQQLVRWTYTSVRTGTGSDLRRVGAVSQPARGQARRTAYATRLSRDLLLVTVDVFRPVPGGGVQVRLDEQQRRWLAAVLRRADAQDVPWVVVQGHTPVMGPVRTRFSSGLRYAGADLLDLMLTHDVDVYLCGEVHDHTVTRRRGLVQMAHGGLFYRGESSYVVGQATRARLWLETRYLDGRPVWGRGKLWSTEGGNGPRHVVYDRGSRVVGAYALRRDPQHPERANRVESARGISAIPYRP